MAISFFFKLYKVIRRKINDKLNNHMFIIIFMQIYIRD